MSETTLRYGYSARGVTQKDVSHASDQLLRAGERPTVEKVRTTIGSGSPNTVGPLLDTWWRSLAARLDAGPVAFHRLPESVLHIVEALWLQTLDESRARAAVELDGDRRSIAQDKERTEVRSHVLSLREAEMESRLRERDKTIADLETRLQLLATALRREQAGRDGLTRRLSALESRPSPLPTRKRPKSAQASKTVKRKPRPKPTQRRLKRTKGR